MLMVNDIGPEYTGTGSVLCTGTIRFLSNVQYLPCDVLEGTVYFNGTTGTALGIRDSRTKI